MPLTHHPVRLFRLSCGCLRAYPMMPAGTEHTVLCVRCLREAMTLFAYPERACGARGYRQEDYFQVSCTRPAGSCDGWHADQIANAEFTVGRPPLARSREGKTGRA
jgi:hypothetical protein